MHAGSGPGVETERAASCDRCGHAPHDFGALPRPEYALLLGFYLGDGTISKAARGVFRLRIVNDLKYRAVSEECALAVAAVMPTSRVGFVRSIGCVEISSYSKAWPCLLPYYGPGSKHEKPITLTDWQSAIVAERPQQFLRGLLLSDGCRITNYFSNASEDIRGLFCAALDQLRVAYTRPKERDVSIARRASVRFLDGFVGPKA